MDKKQSAIIETINLGTCFNDNWIHKNLNLNIYPNRVVTIIGGSGCGKTTLIREMLMLQTISEGKIILSGEVIDSNSTNNNQRIKFILSKVGVMFQEGALFSSLTVLENVMFPLSEYTDFSMSTIKEIAKIKLELSGLKSNSYHLYPKEISGGMSKRVALARALALDPEIIFLDEPTAGLDPNSADAFDELIINLRKIFNLTVIIITHDLNTIWNISDELVYIGNKKILMHDTVKNAANNESVPELYNYFNSTRGSIIKKFYLDRE